MSPLILFLSSLFVPCLVDGHANKDSNRLFENLLSGYNKMVRPVIHSGETLTVRFKLKLSQLLDVHEKNQIMTTNVWLQHIWTDYKLKWNPSDYGGVEKIYIPAEMIWLPDIVLYNNADGNYQVTIMTKAKLFYNGTVEWTPPAIFKSMCQIDVEWFPFDAQTCEIYLLVIKQYLFNDEPNLEFLRAEPKSPRKFGSWTYGGLEVDLKHKESVLERQEQEMVLGFDGTQKETVWVVDKGIDLSDYYPSVEWDILRVPSKRHEKRYPCCDSPFIDITYELHLRRKTLFYTINLIIPSMGISFLTALVFYLPSDSGEKISLCISILISLTLFFLLLEIIPSTSLVIPLIGKYLLFTMVLVTLSVVVTIVTLNVHYRSPTTHTMSPFVRVVFLRWLPPLLLMHRPTAEERRRELRMDRALVSLSPESIHKKFSIRPRDRFASALFDQMDFLSPTYKASLCIPTIDTGDGACGSFSSFPKEQTPVRSAVDSACFIADHLRCSDSDQQVIDDWKFVAMVLDRIFLITFTMACISGTGVIIFRAPSIYDNTEAIA